MANVLDIVKGKEQQQINLNKFVSFAVKRMFEIILDCTRRIF